MFGNVTLSLAELLSFHIVFQIYFIILIDIERITNHCFHLNTRGGRPLLDTRLLRQGIRPRGQVGRGADQAVHRNLREKDNLRQGKRAPSGLEGNWGRRRSLALGGILEQNLGLKASRHTENPKEAESILDLAAVDLGEPDRTVRLKILQKALHLETRGDLDDDEDGLNGADKKTADHLALDGSLGRPSFRDDGVYDDPQRATFGSVGDQALRS